MIVRVCDCMTVVFKKNVVCMSDCMRVCFYGLIRA